MDVGNIITEICEGSIKVIKFNKPKKKNAIDIEMYKKVANILQEASDDENISVVVLTGTGNFYSSGNDFSAVGQKTNELQIALRDFIKAFIEFPKILIAIVNGPAIGIAATTLALCDLVFASENSYFLTPFTKLGITPEGCSTFTFSRIMGERKALEMLLFNYKMPAQEALEYGFVNHLYKPEEIQNKVWDKIFEVTKLKTEPLLYSKQLIRSQVKDYLLKLNETELNAVNRMFQSSRTNTSKL